MHRLTHFKLKTADFAVYRIYEIYLWGDPCPLYTLVYKYIEKPIFILFFPA